VCLHPSLSSLISKFTRQEINDLFRNSKKYLKHPALDILLSPATHEEFGRILVVTPRKVGTAPERNKIRRRLKAIFYESRLFELDYDCVVLVKKEAISLSFNELKALLIETMVKAPKL
jgi:ribonuclease P protein component